MMQKVDFKGKCMKRKLSKCVDVCRSYSQMQDDYARLLNLFENVKEFRCHVRLEGSPETELYSSDFVITMTDGTIKVRECVYRKKLEKPMTARLLDLSKQYWADRGVTDWGLVTDAAL